jgi:hypothetical protein
MIKHGIFVHWTNVLQDVCENDWRRSKLEIECLKGDGMDFFAPKESNCNPFLSHGECKIYNFNQKCERKLNRIHRGKMDTTKTT